MTDEQSQREFDKQLDEELLCYDSWNYRNPDYRRYLLKSLGFEGTLKTAEWWAAAREMGFSFEQFSALSIPTLCDLFAVKIKALEEISDTYAPQDGLFAALKYDAQIRGGRPVGSKLNGSLLKSLRRKTGLDQASFAETCKLDMATIQRAESERSISDESLAKIANGFSKELHRTITPQELKKTSQ